MNDKFFSSPVRLRFGSNGERVVRSAWEGLECLAEWPASGQGYRAAKRACRDALDGWVPAVKARRALVNAAREASIDLVR